MKWGRKRVLEWIEFSSTHSRTTVTPPPLMVGKLLLMYDFNISDVLRHCKEQYILDCCGSYHDDYWLLVEQNVMDSIIDHIISDG